LSEYLFAGRTKVVKKGGSDWAINHHCRLALIFGLGAAKAAILLLTLSGLPAIIFICFVDALISELKFWERMQK